jgi:hypothetical protein
MGHGHAENLQEIELLNAAQKYISSKEAAEAGGIMAAAENAALPATLGGSFADVNLLNQGGPDTWPITAMTYIYVKKDLTYIQDPASQSLLKAFLLAVYSDEYIEQCEEQFGFVRVGGSLRDQALASINALVMDPTAPTWTFETDTQKRIGQGDYVISQKRQSYSEIEQEKLMETIGKLSDRIDLLEAENESLVAKVNMMSGVPADAPVAATPVSVVATGLSADEEKQDATIMAALVMGGVSIALWVIAILVGIVKHADGGSSAAANKSTEDVV